MSGRLLAVVIVGAVSAVAFGGTSILDDNAVIETVLAPGETHIYEIAMRTGEFARLDVDPQLPQVRVVLTSLAGEEIATRARSNGSHYAETISFIAKTSGAYRLTVQSKSPQIGRYIVRVLEHGPATPAAEDRMQAEALFAAARRALAQQRPESVLPGIETSNRALAIFQKLRDDGAVADTEDYIGGAYVYRLSEFDKALPHLFAALALRQCLSDPSARGTSLDRIGDAFRGLGEIRKSTEFFAAALPQKNREIVQEVGVTLRNLAMAHDDLGDEDALPHYMQLLQMLGDAGEAVGVGFVHDSIANHFINRGQWQEALQHEEEALRAWRSANFILGEAYGALILGIVYQARGELERALASYQKVETIPGSSNARSRAQAMWRISTVYEEMGDYDRAIDQQQKLLRLQREKSDRAMEVDVLRSLAASHRKRHDPASALKDLNEALPLSRNYPMLEASVLRDAAAVQLDLGMLDDARRSASRALEIFRSLQSAPGEASVHMTLARIAADVGDLQSARAEAESTVRLIETVRGNISNPDTRASFLASVWEAYDFYIDLLMRIDPASALRASERAHARSFLELLTESRTETASLGRLRSLRDQISAKTQAQLQLAGRRSADAEAIKRELDELYTEYEQEIVHIRRDDPVSEPAGVEEIRRVLDASTILLEYSLGEKRSFLWVVTRDKFFSYELPPRDQIESAVRTAYKSLAKPSPQQKGLVSISRTLLAPAAGTLRAKRLLIVPDGALHYLPFAVLPSPTSGQPLIVDHEIVTLPSASMIAPLRRHARHPKSSKVLAVFADPVFERSDSRLTAQNEGPASGVATRGPDDDSINSDFERSARETRLADLARLPFTRREATAILSLVPPSQRKEALDFDAARRAVLDSDVGKYRLIHFATHGLFNDLHPELSGIVLSMVDEKGREQNGFLTTADVFNLSLTADLVVLSGCRTALGKEIRGEGIAGLTRAFMYAGAPRVVASLWNVNDAATAELMKRFYQGMLGPGKMSPPAALRSAQLSLLKERRWSAPYYWAAFVIQGEWN